MTEVVTRVRGNAALRTLAPAQPLDPNESVVDGLVRPGWRLYLNEFADVLVGDELTVRGETHLVFGKPANRAGFALVVDVQQFAPVGAGGLDATVTIAPVGGTPTWNPATDQTETTAAAAVYEGPAAITIVSTSDGKAVDVAGDQIDDRLYQVTLPAGAGDDVEVEHVITVDDAPNTELIGQRLTVTSISRPSRETGRVLFARLYDN